jgi:hypothetical protein
MKTKLTDREKELREQLKKELAALRKKYEDLGMTTFDELFRAVPTKLAWARVESVSQRMKRIEERERPGKG